MPRIDFFTAPDCGGCAQARDVIRAFAVQTPGVEVHEWDLTVDPGPAVGRGIFVTPAVLVNGERVLYGVPALEELRKSCQGSAASRQPLEHRPAQYPNS